MDKRQYVQRARAEAADATRRRILDAARATLERGPGGRAEGRGGRPDRGRVALDGLPAVRLAGRPLRRARAPSPRRGRVRRADPRVPPARRAARRCAARSGPRSGCTRRCRSWPGRCSRWRPIDPDAVAAIRAIEDGRRPGQAEIARRLAEQGYLRDGVDVDEATDILTVITSFQAFDELFSGSGLPAEVVADRLVAMAERSICRPDV